MKNFIQIHLKYLVILAVLAMMSPAAHAFKYKRCLGQNVRWGQNGAHLKASSVSFASENWQRALDASVDLWNQNPSNFRFTLEFGDNSLKRGNKENEVWFTNDDALLDGAPARALVSYYCIDYWLTSDTVAMVETDIIFDARTAWTPFMSSRRSLNAYGGTLRPFWNTAMHEMGHALWLGHVNTHYGIMGTDFTHLHVNGPTARAYIGEDTANGAVHLYGNGPTFQDVSVTHWKFGSAAGEYSDHVRTQMFNTSGAVLPSTDITTDLRYNVDLGQDVQVEFTYENNGLTPQSFNVGFYVSTNDIITTLDRKVTNAGMTLSRDSVLTARHTIRIPNDLVRGRTYWIGAVVDDADTVREYTDANNATFIPIRIN